MMTTNTRKLATFRQLSLNSELPEAPRPQRNVLRRQFSEDIPDLTEKLLDASIGIKVSFATKTVRKNHDQPPPIRVAWGEDNDNAVVVTKCKENVRPPSILSRRYSIEKDSILHSKQDMGDRLHDKVPEKTNINIYLGHNTQRSEEVSSNNRLSTFSDCRETKVTEKTEHSPRPKIISPLIVPENNGGAKNMFQIRKNPRNRLSNNDLPYTPSQKFTKLTDRPTSVVVVPVFEQNKHEEVHHSKFNTTLETESGKKNNCLTDTEDNIDTNENNPKPVNVLIKPISSAIKRERFQKRTNSAFNSTIRDNTIRPPLIRSSSAPSKPDNRSKFLATKRKIKPASKKEKSKSSPKPSNADNVNASEKEDTKVKLKALNRQVSVNGGEVETMVSLVSPEESDVDDPEPEKKLVVSTNTPSNKAKRPVAAKISPTKNDDVEVHRSTSLRKTVKSVSFQQSSIHAIRSFSASFPSRRASMATTLAPVNTTSPSLRPTTSQEKNMNEKRNSISSEDERGPKRRLVRSKTEDCPSSSSYLPPEDDSEECSENASSEIKIELEEADLTPYLPPKVENNDVVKEEVFENPKEKQCWDMYCKMTEKGINVSYDTILRGLLTPTEYRMRVKKETVPAEDDHC